MNRREMPRELRLTRLLACAWLLGMLSAPPVNASSAEPRQPSLAGMFQDHAVLQRDRPINLWGRSKPRDKVWITLSGRTARATADASGNWRATLPAIPAGGPFTLVVRSEAGSTQTVTDVLVGDVFLCSGQSNMELPVARSLNSEHEIESSVNSRIRLLTIPHATSPGPLDYLEALPPWAAAGPESIRDFSAACYYFARELQKTLAVPLGLIQASWGGSRIEPWMSEPSLRAHGGFDQRLDLLHAYALNVADGNQRLGKLWEDWWHSQVGTGSTPWSEIGDAEWQSMPEPMRDWKTWGVPALATHDGMVWFRRRVTLTAPQAAAALSVSIGAIDEVDETWVNGLPIANSFGYATERTYELPAGALHTGDNSIVINVLSTWDAGGMYGPPEHLAIHLAGGETVSLAHDWQYKLVPDTVGFPPRAPWESVAGLTSIYNAMIAPLQQLTLRGVLWYQGESNAGDAAQYATLLAQLMQGWRRQFAADLPFLVVQLPNFGTPSAAPTPSAWASLREAQRRAVAGDSNAALIVTIDVGESQELHPPNKQAVGVRLADAARQLIYRQPPTRTTAPKATREGAGVSVALDPRLAPLRTYSANEALGFEVCGPEQASCHFTRATVDHANIVLSEADSFSTRVRYCWGDAPLCNLFDATGVPIGPFEINVQ